MLAEVAAGVIVEAIAGTARWLRRESAGGDGSDQAALLRWFDTYRLSAAPDGGPTLPDGADVRSVEEFFRCDDSQAVLHELLAARLTDAPESVLGRLREAYAASARAALGTVFATAGQPHPDAAVETLGRDFFDHCDLEISGMVGELAGSDSGLLDRIRQEAFWARIISVLGAVERHTRALSLRDSACLAADQAFADSYRRQVAFAHGSLEPPDFERRRRVPIDALHVSPGIVAVGRAGVNDGPTLALADLELALDRTVLLGDPGCGKSTTCQVLMHRRATDPRSPLPFLVVLRDFALADADQRSVVDHIEHRLETYYQCAAPPGAVDRLLLSGAASVVFDGLDELVDSTRRREMTEIVELFCSRYPLAQVLVTSRIVGYSEAQLDSRFFECYRLGPFGAEQAKAYVEKWFALEENTPEEARRSAESFLDESSGLTDLRANPLMLALMCILYRGTGSMPRSRPEVYEQCATLLFHKWDVRRRIHVELAMSRLVEPAMRHLAFWLFTRDGDAQAVTERELVDRVVEFLDGRGYEEREAAEEAARQFVAFCRGRAWVFSEVGTTAGGDGLYTFTHRTFLEYFAAAELASTSDTPEALARRIAPKVARQEWDTVGQLAVQIKDRTTADGAARVFAVLLDERRRRSAAGRANVLAFLARCLTGVDPPPRIVRRLTREAMDHLMRGDPETEEFSGPVVALLSSCWNCRDLVADELTGAIADAVRSTDASRRQVALVLAAYAGAMAQSTPVSSEWWWDFARSMIDEYAPEFRAAAEDHIGLMDVCLCHGLTDLEDCFERCRLEFGAIFEGWGMGIRSRNSTWWPYATRCVFVLLIGTEGCRPLVETALRDCGTIGSWLGQHPSPPWTDRADDVSPFLDYIAESLASMDRRVRQPLDPDGYLGAAVMLLTSMEASREPMIERFAPLLGPLTDLYPYAATRFGVAAAPLPDLPVPDGFGEILRAWARREVDFIGRPGPPPPP
ncbi:NACHT domain-containing protein [Streptomyces sp. NPDC047043]|uniref:NACHT domain-containing protein n=1 Tax=Streptomyces sp. NPDC047043 TaxID=3154497 RepID=UPI0033CBD1F4